MSTEIQQCIDAQRRFFQTQKTQSIDFRIQTLTRFEKSVLQHTDALIEAAKTDLHKADLEAIQGEIALSLGEIRSLKKNIKRWTKPKRTKGVSYFPLSRGEVHRNPLGISAIFSPYNHPFSTTFAPVATAVAAGNCVIVKPSELVPNAAKVIEKIITDAFSPEHVAVLQGGPDISQEIIHANIDHIFFTGSTNVGKIVMNAAAEKPIPVTLQLGGKCPAIISEDADLESAARRIVWAKFWNAGQSCNTVDHVFVHSNVKEQFLSLLKKYIIQFYGNDPARSKDYGRIVNERHFDRILRLLDGTTVLHGGASDAAERYISPTLVDNVSPNAPIRTEEIFGPILPLYYYDDIDQLLKTIANAPKSLAIYIFSNNKKLSRRILSQIDSGTACINDLMIQASSPDLPTGGLGASGFGDIHGFDAFCSFTHTRSILYQSTLDFPFRFPPYPERLTYLLRKLL